MTNTNNQLQRTTARPIVHRATRWLIALAALAIVHVAVGQQEALALQVSPPSLSFSGSQGGTNPPNQDLTIWKRGTRTKSWTANSPVQWVTVTPSTGSLTTERDTMTVGVTLGSLAPGQYTTSIIITTVGTKGGIKKTAVPVSLTVGSPVSTTGFSISPPSLSFSGIAGAPNSTGSVTVANTGTTSLTVTWSEAVSWLIDVQPGSTQTIAAGRSATFTTTASFAGLTAGTYSGVATLSGGGMTKQVPVSLTVSGTAATPTIQLSPTSLAFTGVVGGTNPAAKSFSITNPTGGTLTWTTASSASWLTLSSASGTTNTEVDTINASVKLSGLAAGTYTATITIASAGAANSPKVIPVSLTLSMDTASSATLTWNANAESNLAGYKIYSGTQSGVYGAPVSVGKATSYVATNLTKGTTYFFTVTAYDTAGNESLPAAEVSKSIF